MDGRPQVRPRCYQFSGETSSIRSITVSDMLAVLSAMMSSAVRLKLLSDVLIFAEIKLSLSPARFKSNYVLVGQHFVAHGRNDEALRLRN